MSAFLKNLPVKVLGGTGVYLSEDISLHMTPYSPPPHTVYVCTLYSIGTYKHMDRGEEGVELTRERVIKAMLHKAGRKCQHA